MGTVEVNRRTLMAGAGAGALVALSDPLPARAARRLRSALLATSTRTIRVVRASDQLAVQIDLLDVTLTGNQIAPSGANPAVRFTFGSQHRADRAFSEPDPFTPPSGIVASVSAGTSVVVTPVTGTVDFTLDELLSMAEQALTVQSAAGAPNGEATVLEIPAGLAISPVSDVTMTASRTAYTVAGATEVWVAKFQGASREPQFHAVHNLASGADLVPRLPDSTQRQQLVDNTISAGPPTPFTARKLWLSSSGAFAKFEGDWPSGVLTRYRHTINTGRDLHVEITQVGYLAPFGHRAAILEIADRIWAVDAGGVLTSVVRLERYLSVLQPTVQTGTRGFQKKDGRGNLFTQVTASVDESAQIDPTTVTGLNASPITGVSDVFHFGTSNDFMVSYTATDRDGNLVSFELPATFISKTVAYTTGAGSASSRFVDLWNDASRADRRTIELDGQKVAYADPIASGVDATARPTYTMVLKLQTSDGNATDRENGDFPGFNQALDSAMITDDFVGVVTGEPGDAFEVTHHNRWLDFGDDAGDAANFDLAYLTLSTPKTGTLGGNLPTVSVSSVQVVAEIFNQTAGVAPDVPDINTPWDPATALGEGSKLLGSILMDALLDLVDLTSAVPGIDIPNTEVTTDGDVITIVYSFQPTLKSNETVGFLANANTRTQVVITTVTSISGDVPTNVTTEMTVSDFAMVYPPGNLTEIIVIDYERVVATISSNGQLSVEPKMSGWTLGEDLSFLQPVMDTLTELGSLNVGMDEDFIHFDADVNLPSMNFGMVAIYNFSIGFGMSLPLDGKPLELRSNVGSMADPVEMKVSVFGGGFYVELELDFHQDDSDWTVRTGITAFMEIGGDFVVVQASVRLQIQLDFTFIKAEGNTTIVRGAISLEGVIGLLGLVEVSASLVGTVTYNSGTETAVCKGTIHWSVETFLGGPDGKIPLGSVKVELGDGQNNRTASGRAAGPVSDTPSFGDFFSKSEWTDYGLAFA